MKKDKIILILTLFLMPMMVFASSDFDEGFGLGPALIIEAFVTLHMSFFVLLPLSKIIAPENSKSMFWKLFIIRVIVLLFFDLFVTSFIAIVDIIILCIGAFIITPILMIKTQKTTTNTTEETIDNTNPPKCQKCGAALLVTDNFCQNCGQSIDKANLANNIQNQTTSVPKIPVLPSAFDPIYNLSEDKMVEEFINRELTKAGIDKNSKLIPQDVLKKKRILNLIFSILVFIYISLIFFHFPIQTYIIGLIILFIYYKLTRRYNLMKYLKKQLKARPSEKIINIVMSVKNSFVTDNSKNIFIPTIILAIILPLIIFIEPRIMYEKVDNGYAVRFYTFGLTNFTTATIPETYKGENVVSLRGNTFSNMFFLKKVTLPDTIIEIRGQAFKNDVSLIKVKLPSNLEHLGGGSFYNCTSLASITLPDTLIHIGGEAFYNATSLETIKLPEGINEIRGNTFENCSSLKSINIPNNVTRIGGHAFYGCYSLSEVAISENSRLTEIGSSAFRRCLSLSKITLPNNDIYINERAFKESPTDVKIFGEINYGSLINSNNYAYDTYIYIHTGESQKINMFRTNALLQDAYILLENVTVNNDSNEFTLKYSDATGEQIFTLSAKEPYKVVNDNIALEISEDYVLKYDNRISLNIYYN